MEPVLQMTEAVSYTHLHSFSRILGAGRPDGEDMALVGELGERAADKVKNLTELPREAIQVNGRCV